MITDWRNRTYMNINYGVRNYSSKRDNLLCPGTNWDWLVTAVTNTCLDLTDFFLTKNRLRIQIRRREINSIAVPYLHIPRQSFILLQDPRNNFFIDCVQLYFIYGFTNIVLYSVNCLWLVAVTLIFDGTPQIIVQRCQIAAPKWPNDISSAADNAIFKNREQNIECSFVSVARSAVLLKPNVANILLFNFCEQKLDQHGPITIAMDCNGLSLLIFEEKWPNYAFWIKICTKQWFVLGASVFQCMRAGFLCSKCDNFVCLHTRQDLHELHLKRWFYCQNRHLL